MWTQVTTETKKGRAAIKMIGGAIDAQFDQDSVKYWQDFWANRDRQIFMVCIRKAFKALDTASRGCKPLPDHLAHARALQDNGYYLGGLKARKILLRNKAALSGADEIRAMLEADMFERIFTEDGNWMFSITHPVIITAKKTKEVFAMGRYCIKWRFKPLSMTDKGSDVLSFPAHANLQADYCIHPHIHTSGRWCGGDLTDPLYRLMQAGLIADAMGLILQYLTTGEGHPYRNLVYWRQGGSASGKPVCACCHKDRAVRTCLYCFATLCQPCRKCPSGTCSQCGHKLKLAQQKVRKVKTDVKKKKAS